MLEWRTIRLSDGGAVSLHWGRTRRTGYCSRSPRATDPLMLGVVLTRGEGVALGRELLHPRGDPESFG